MGKPSSGQLVSLGDRVHFEVTVKNSEALGKPDPRRRDGVWLGVRGVSGEGYVEPASADPSQRLNRRAADDVLGTPWGATNCAGSAG